MVERNETDLESCREIQHIASGLYRKLSWSLSVLCVHFYFQFCTNCTKIEYDPSGKKRMIYCSSVLLFIILSSQHFPPQEVKNLKDFDCISVRIFSKHDREDDQ